MHIRHPGYLGPQPCRSKLIRERHVRYTIAVGVRLTSARSFQVFNVTENIFISIMYETRFQWHDGHQASIICIYKGNPLTSFPVSRSACFSPLSPSTSTHQPSPPLPPFPPTAAPSKFFFANAKPSASKLPGCIHTAATPASFASRRTCKVTGGGVIIESEVVAGEESAEAKGTDL